jgi:hypothetical protein
MKVVFEHDAYGAKEEEGPLEKLQFKRGGKVFVKK